MKTSRAGVERVDDHLAVPQIARGGVCGGYEARKFGVRSAMPSVTAGRLCPNGIFLRPRMEAYSAESREIMAVVQAFAGELIQQVSVDEAYADVSARIKPGRRMKVWSAP